MSMTLFITYLVKRRAGRREATPQNNMGRVPGSGPPHIMLTSSELLEEKGEEPREQSRVRKDYPSIFPS